MVQSLGARNKQVLDRYVLLIIPTLYCWTGRESRRLNFLTFCLQWIVHVGSPHKTVLAAISAPNSIRRCISTLWCESYMDQRSKPLHFPCKHTKDSSLVSGTKCHPRLRNANLNYMNRKLQKLCSKL